MSDPWHGEERRKDSASVQRDLGRIDNELTNLSRRIGDHISETEKYHTAADVKFETRRKEVDTQLNTILAAVQGNQTVAAEQRGGWKMLAKIGGGGAVGGGLIAAILEWLSGP
jgi:hypothetical protein